VPLRPATNLASTHSSAILLGKEAGHLPYVRGVNLVTAPREPLFLRLAAQSSKGLSTTHPPAGFLRHRDASQHACPVAEPVPAPKNEAAHALLAKHFPNLTTGSSSKPVNGPPRKVPTDPKKLAQFQKVELMKMRHRAVPADPKDKPGSIGIDQRLHVKVRYKGDREMVEKIFWFRKVASVPPFPPIFHIFTSPWLRVWVQGEQSIYLLVSSTSGPLR
jgi:hypothetical protein